MMHGPALLFCPADRPERYAKAASAADVVIVDLEDAVASADKPAARRALRHADLDPARTIVRVNPATTIHLAADLEALRSTPFTTIMLAKAESADQLEPVRAYRVVALCETALGVVRAEEIARHPATVALMWGAEDLAASMGGHASRHVDGHYRDVARHARSRVLLAAKAHGRAAIDAVHLDIGDVEGLRAEAEDAAASGFDATACIHPSQVPTIRAAYAPSAERVEWARAVLAEADGSGGVFRFRGGMVDEPILRQAREILRSIDAAD